MSHKERNALKQIDQNLEVLKIGQYKKKSIGKQNHTKRHFAKGFLKRKEYIQKKAAKNRTLF